jgi:hypothetical protein
MRILLETKAIQSKLQEQAANSNICTVAMVAPFVIPNCRAVSGCF